MNKTNILICDDQQKFIEKFKDNHSNHYDIHEVNDIKKLFKKIDEVKPHIVLLDLYHPKDSNTGFEIRIEKAEQELKNLDRQIEVTKQAVDNVWEPIGLDILDQIRTKFSPDELPVMIYSQRGLVLMEDEQLQKVEKLKGHWMLKNVSSSTTEKIRIDRIVEELSTMNPTIMKYRGVIIILTTILCIISSYFLWNFDKTMELVLSQILSVIFGIISAMIFTRYFERKL